MKRCRYFKWLPWLPLSAPHRICTRRRTFGMHPVGRVFLVIGIIFTMTSCNDHNEAPGEEKQKRDLISKYPDSLLLKENLVQYFRENGKYKEALEVVETVLKKDSLNDRFQDIKATLNFENGDTINAIRAFEKAVSIYPRPAYIISLASIYAQTGNRLALTMADSLLKMPAANAKKQAYFIKGSYYSYSGNKLKALPYFDTCLSMDYRDMFAYREKAICLYDLDKYAPALEILKEAVAVQKNFEEGYYWMGRCYEKLQKRKEAINSYEMALQIDSGYVEAREALGTLQQ